MTIMRAETSFGNQANDGDYEAPEMGSTRVSSLPTSGGVVQEHHFEEQYGEHTAPGTVTRNGSTVHVNSMSDLAETDLVTLSDGGNDIQVEIGTLRAMGLMHLVESHVYGENPAEEFDQLQELDELSKEMDDNPDRVVRSNLDSAFESGDISDRVHTAASLLYDAGEMMGVSAQDTLNGAMAMLESGDYSLAADMGLDAGTAQATIETAYHALEAEALGEIGQVGLLELERAGNLYPEVKGALMRVGASVLSGQSGRGVWQALHSNVMQRYGKQLNSIR